MTRELNAFSALSEHADSDMCVVCLLSHGNSGLVFSTDGREVSTEWVLRKFNNEGCPALKGKPKFVLLQACRGDEPDYGFVPRLDTPVDDGSTATDAKVSEQIFFATECMIKLFYSPGCCPSQEAVPGQGPHLGGHADRLRHSAGIRRKQEPVQRDMVRRVNLPRELVHFIFSKKKELSFGI